MKRGLKRFIPAGLIAIFFIAVALFLALPAKAVNYDGWFYNVMIKGGYTTINGVEYVWPAADGTATYQLTTDGSGTLSWAAAGGMATDFALTADADAGDKDIKSIDELEFYDAGLVIDGGTNGVLSISSDGTLALNSADWGISTTGTITNASMSADQISAGNLTIGNSYLSIGTDPADAGTIRLPNAGSIQFEADTTGTDVNALTVNSSEAVLIGSSGASGVTITPALTLSSTLTAGGQVTMAANDIVGTTGLINYTNFDVDAAGGVVCTSLDAGSGDITTTGSLNVGNVVESAIQPASGNLTINGATGANSITIGNLSTSGITVSDNVAFGVTSLFTAGAGLGFRQATEVISSSTADQLDIDAAGELEIATAVLDINLTDSSDIQVTGTGKNFDIATSDGDITLTAVGGSNGDIVLSAGDDLDFDATGKLDILAGETFSIDGTGASNVSATSGNLTLSTITSGSVDILSAEDVDIDASGTSAVTINTANHATTTTGAITLTTGNVAGGAGNGGAITLATGTSAGGTAGAVHLDSAGAIDIDATTTVDIEATTTFSIDGTGASNVSATSGNLTLSTITSGSVDILSATDVDIDASGTSGITINTADDATVDATACGDITLTGGDKSAGTGDGGDIILVPGATTGGTQGYIKINGDALVATTEKIYFQDTGTFINSPSDGKIEIEADAAGLDDITLDGGVTIPTGHVLTMTDAGSITLAGETVTAHKEVSVAVYATADTAVSFGILPVINNCKITHISIGFVAIPASAAGTVLLEIYNRDGGAASDNLLGAATYDLEGMTNMVTADMSLTATGADLQPDDGDFVYCVITSNNADMTGGTGGVITVQYTID